MGDAFYLIHLKQFTSSKKLEAEFIEKLLDSIETLNCKFSGWFYGEKSELIENQTKKQLAEYVVTHKSAGPQFWHNGQEIDFLMHIQTFNDRVEIAYSFDRVFFNRFTREDIKIQEKTLKLIVNLARETYYFLGSCYGFGDISEYIPLDKEIVSLNEIKDIYFMNIFSPEQLSKLEKKNKQQLIPISVYIKEELSDGGLLLVLTDNPFYRKSEDEWGLKQKLKDEIKRRIGIK